MKKRPFNHFMPTIALTAILLASLSLKAAVDEGGDLGDRQPARILIQPITNALHWHEESPDAVELRTKVTELQHTLDDGTLDHLMVLGSQYMQSITIPRDPEIEEDTAPQVNELLTVLDLLAGMERDHPEQRTAVSHFAYSTLEHYFPSVSFEDQQFYLNLFHGLLVDTNFDEELTRLIINWSLDFMRHRHTQNECRQIAWLVRDYILEHPEENYNMSPLQAAFQEEDHWPDEDVIRELEGFIGHPEEEQEESLSEGSQEGNGPFVNPSYQAASQEETVSLNADDGSEPEEMV